MYGNFGCRCEPCKAAGAEKAKRLRAADPERARNQVREYKSRHRKTLAAAARRYYAEHTQDVRAYQARRYADFKEQLGVLKAFVGCRGCGWHPRTLEEARLLDWHHRDPATKSCKVSLMHSRSLESVNAEIDKCDVLCQECHRAVHAASPTGS